MDQVTYQADYYNIGLLSFLSKLKVIGRWAAFHLDDDGTTIPIDLRTGFSNNKHEQASS